MPNAIKYNVSAETLSLKKGNFWIGTGDVGKGPTSSTGYYNGITPPTGGYTIYLNKESNGPSIYTVNTEAQLTGLTSSIAGQTLTTSGACLNWFATQTDKMILNKDYPPIITNGLVMNLDAAFTPSYPTTETTWYDVSSGGNNGTLVNGPTYNPDYGGSIVFDGTDDYVSVPKQTAFVNVSQFTLMAWMKRRVVGSKVVCHQGEDLNNDVAFELWNDGAAYFEVGNASNSYATIGNTSTDWQYLTMVFDGTQTGNSGRLKCYINGILLNVSYNGTIPSTTSNTNSIFAVGNTQGSGYNNPSDGNIAQVLIYNRAITVAEIAQNYCATVPIVTNGLIFNVDAGTQLSYVSGSTSWVDTAGNTVGALTNNPTYNSSNVGSIVFDGTDDYVAWPNNPLSSLTSAKTYDVWIKFTNAQNAFPLGCGTLHVYIQNDNTWYINHSQGAFYISGWTFSSGWTNFIYSFDGTNHLCYINGVSYVVNSGGGVNSQTVLYIGSRVNLDSFLNGNIATTRVYNRGLSATEILQNYNATKGRFGL